jgi:type I restriction enzyme S subunit
VAHALNSRQLRSQAAALVHGVGRPRLGLKWLRTLEAPLAPLSEQHRIVSAIESYFTRLDDAVATLERVQRNLKRYRASVLKAAVEGRLVPTEAELARAEGRDYEPASVLLERILAERRRRWEESELAKLKAKGKAPKDNAWKAKYVEPVAPDTSELPELPEGWCWASVDQLVENHDRDRVPIKRADRAKRRGRYPYYGASGAIDTIDEYLFDGSFLLVGEDGANLLARSTPIAFQAHGQFWVNNHAHILRTYLDLPLGYMEAFFNATELARYVTGTAQPKLPQAAMNRIPVPLCPRPEQFRIVEAVESQLSIADDVTVALDTNNRRCRSLRQSILKWAFEGRLVDQDPNDEPASALLDRIRAEREAKPIQPTRSPRRARATNRTGA